MSLVGSLKYKYEYLGVIMSENKSIFPIGSMAYEADIKAQSSTSNDAKISESFFPKGSMAYESDVKEGNISPAVGQGFRPPRVKRATPQINAENMYWPPYDFTQGQYIDIDIVYTKEADSAVFMSIEEAEEFYENLKEELGLLADDVEKVAKESWKTVDGKDKLDKGKMIYDAGDNLKDAYQVAKGLGGLGVTAYVKETNGKDYVIIKNYKKYKKTLAAGNRWRANNPQVVQLGLGAKNMARRMLKVGFVVDIVFSIAFNAVDVFMRDDRTMYDLFGRSGTDIVKGMLATGVATLAAVIATVTVGVPFLVAGAIFAAVSLGAGWWLDSADNEYHVSDNLVKKMKESMQ